MADLLKAQNILDQYRQGLGGAGGGAAIGGQAVQQFDAERQQKQARDREFFAEDLALLRFAAESQANSSRIKRQKHDQDRHIWLEKARKAYTLDMLQHSEKMSKKEAESMLKLAATDEASLPLLAYDD